MSEGECSRGGNSSISMSVLLGTNIEGIRGAFVIAGARSLRCVLFGRHLQEGMAYRLVHKMLHATVSDDDLEYCDRLLTEIVPFQLGRRSRDWRVQQHRSFADRHSSDPALASYGVTQAEQLAQHLLATDPTIDAVYSSPFYRCIQTLAPFTAARTAQNSKDPKTMKALVNLEAGLGEFYGLARFDHPSPATYNVLAQHFPDNLAPEQNPIIVPSTKGESIPQLHDRIAYCLDELIKRLAHALC
jgi:broad specificity phosphatase PhoE